VDPEDTRKFPLVERFVGLRMGVDLSAVSPGATAVVESSRRLRCEQSYGYVHALWWTWLEDGRSAISVPPGAKRAVAALAAGVLSAGELSGPDLVERLKIPVNRALAASAMPAVDRVAATVSVASSGPLPERAAPCECRRLAGPDVPVAAGLTLPSHAFPDGVVYGVVADGVVAAVAYAHRTGEMENLVADMGVETAMPYRRRGYARAAVRAVAEHFASTGGESLYTTSPDNAASIATASSAGFRPWARGRHSPSWFCGDGSQRGGDGDNKEKKRR